MQLGGGENLHCLVVADFVFVSRLLGGVLDSMIDGAQKWIGVAHCPTPLETIFHCNSILLHNPKYTQIFMLPPVAYLAFSSYSLDVIKHHIYFYIHGSWAPPIVPMDTMDTFALLIVFRFASFSGFQVVQMNSIWARA